MKYLILLFLLMSTGAQAFTAAGVLTCYEGGTQILKIPVDGTKPYSMDTFRKTIATDVTNGLKYTIHADCILAETP